MMRLLLSMGRRESVGGTTGGRRGDMMRVCITCRWRGLDVLPGTDVRPGQHLFDLLVASAGADLAGAIHPICCLSNCFRSCNAVIAGRGKPAVMLSLLAPDAATVDALLGFLRRYRATPTGATAACGPELPVVQVLGAMPESPAP